MERVVFAADWLSSMISAIVWPDEIQPMTETSLRCPLLRDADDGRASSKTLLPAGQFLGTWPNAALPLPSSTLKMPNGGIRMCTF